MNVKHFFMILLTSIVSCSALSANAQQDSCLCEIMYVYATDKYGLKGVKREIEHKKFLNDSTMTTLYGYWKPSQLDVDSETVLNIHDRPLTDWPIKYLKERTDTLIIKPSGGYYQNFYNHLYPYLTPRHFKERVRTNSFSSDFRTNDTGAVPVGHLTYEPLERTTFHGETVYKFKAVPDFGVVEIESLKNGQAVEGFRQVDVFDKTTFLFHPFKGVVQRKIGCCTYYRMANYLETEGCKDIKEKLIRSWEQATND